MHAAASMLEITLLTAGWGIRTHFCEAITLLSAGWGIRAHFREAHKARHGEIEVSPLQCPLVLHS